jgi:hypothetical protein
MSTRIRHNDNTNISHPGSLLKQAAFWRISGRLEGILRYKWCGQASKKSADCPNWYSSGFSTLFQTGAAL